MTHAESHHDIIAHDTPLPGALVDELLEFWQTRFQVDYGPFRSILNDDERGANRDIVYRVAHDGWTVGTSHLTNCESTPALGGLGEVGTAPEHRGTGIASALCARARDDFRAAGGQALFLGTGNPDAARIYHRLGWRKLPGANVMVCISNDQPPDAFLSDYFEPAGRVTVADGSAADRIPMIPLLIAPHDWLVMDANVAMHSTRRVTQESCMGLYPRYPALAADCRGAWFAAHTDDQRPVGLSTARLDDTGGCQIDGFTHDQHRPALPDLLEAAAAWAHDHAATPCWARIAIEDENKMSGFEALGFRRDREDGPFDLPGRQVPSIRLLRDPSSTA